MSNHVFKQITIIGLGLIGSSIARAIHKNNLAKTVVGCDVNEISQAFAVKEKFIDAVHTEPQKAVIGSDLIIIATPPATLGTVAENISQHLKAGAVVMDVSSVKQPAIDAISPHIPDNVIYIPAHPIAGREISGVRAGQADLFVNRKIIITPKEPPEMELFDKLSAFWQGMGAKLEAMPPDVHDVVYAYMSHLPQLIAFCLEQPLGEFFSKTDNNPVYKNFLRISRSSPNLWAEIFELNKTNILQGLDRYIDVITHVRKELQTAPENEKSGEDEWLAYTILFPRIVASCLVTTVMEVEKKAGFPFAKYAGAGFADLTAPAIIPPDEDIERISAQYKLVESILDKFLLRLKVLRSSL